MLPREPPCRGAGGARGAGRPRDGGKWGKFGIQCHGLQPPEPAFVLQPRGWFNGDSPTEPSQLEQVNVPEGAVGLGSGWGWGCGGSTQSTRCPLHGIGWQCCPIRFPEFSNVMQKSHHANYANHINYSCYSAVSPETSGASRSSVLLTRESRSWGQRGVRGTRCLPHPSPSSRPHYCSASPALCSPTHSWFLRHPSSPCARPAEPELCGAGSPQPPEPGRRRVCRGHAGRSLSPRWETPGLCSGHAAALPALL